VVISVDVRRIEALNARSLDRLGGQELRYAVGKRGKV
jgi:hypothetical protein